MKKTLLGLLSATLLMSPHTATAEDEVNVYSARKEALIKPLLDQFTEQTGVRVNLITGKADALITRMAKEGEFSPADVLVTTDAGRLVRAQVAGLTQTIDSDIDLSGVNPAYVDEERQWVALTLRSRPIMYMPTRVLPEELSTMEALTDEKWQGRICIRSSSNIYNQSMVAAMMEQLGEQATQTWAQGMVKNFARPPKGGDRDQIKAMVAGQCDIAIANTYYLAGMLESEGDERDIASQVKVFWPNQSDRGAHVNISGIAVAKHAPNKDAAEKLVAFMLGEKAQQWYAQTNGEYPVIDGVAWSETLKGMGKFKGETISLRVVGEKNADALKLMDRAGWK